MIGKVGMYRLGMGTRHMGSDKGRIVHSPLFIVGKIYMGKVVCSKHTSQWRLQNFFFFF